MLSIFSCACWPSACFLWEDAYSGPLPSFYSGCLFDIELYEYILDINPLVDILFANVFSYSVDYLFLLMMVSFAVQKLLSLIRPHLFVFAFVSFALGDISKKILL